MMFFHLMSIFGIIGFSLLTMVLSHATVYAIMLNYIVITMHILYSNEVFRFIVDMLDYFMQSTNILCLNMLACIQLL